MCLRVKKLRYVNVLRMSDVVHPICIYTGEVLPYVVVSLRIRCIQALRGFCIPV